jgi:hypothetical protein
MNITDLLKMLVTVLVSALPSNLLKNLIGTVLNDLESIVSNNAIEHALLFPIIEAIKNSLGIVTPVITDPVNQNQTANYTFPPPALPTSGFVPGDLGNRVNFISNQLAEQKIDVSKVDTSALNKCIFTPYGWQSDVLQSLAAIQK